MSHICANDEYLSQVDTTNRPESIVIRYVSVVSLSRLFECKVVDVFSFYLQIFRAQIFPRSQPMRESNTSIKHVQVQGNIFSF
jgi:hypothetical protein